MTTSNKNSKAIALELIPEYIKSYFDSLSETEKAEFFGFGRGGRADIDTPTCITLPEEHHITKGNAGIMIGLDRPNNIFSGFGGMKNTHCAAIDIVAGRLGSRAVSKDAKGKLVEVDPNLKLDAARLYLSQKADIDGYLELKPGKVGNTTKDSPRSAAALKADTVRIVARENIKLVTRTDQENSQGGKTDNKTTQPYGIDLIAMNDDSGLQPLVKGDNMVRCLEDLISAVHFLRELFNNFLQYDRLLTSLVAGHTHITGVPGQPTAPSELLLNPSGLPQVIEQKLAKVEAQIVTQQEMLNGVLRNYLLAPGGAEASENDKSLFILSKYNNAN